MATCTSVVFCSVREWGKPKVANHDRKELINLTTNALTAYDVAKTADIGTTKPADIGTTKLPCTSSRSKLWKERCVATRIFHSCLSLAVLCAVLNRKVSEEELLEIKDAFDSFCYRRRRIALPPVLKFQRDPL